jgi:hypothetical protein
MMPELFTLVIAHGQTLVMIVTVLVLMMRMVMEFVIHLRLRDVRMLLL